MVVLVAVVVTKIGRVETRIDADLWSRHKHTHTHTHELNYFNSAKLYITSKDYIAIHNL